MLNTAVFLVLLIAALPLLITIISWIVIDTQEFIKERHEKRTQQTKRSDSKHEKD